MHHGEQDMCCCTSHTRQFLTKKEKIKKLTEYKNWLDDESKGVEEAIEKLKSN
jgi:ribosome recycling factor